MKRGVETFFTVIEMVNGLHLKTVITKIRMKQKSYPLRNLSELAGFMVGSFFCYLTTNSRVKVRNGSALIISYWTNWRVSGGKAIAWKVGDCSGNVKFRFS